MQPSAKQDLHDYLRGGRETLVWKLEGLTEYDMRRPLTPTGTNLLGLVKHNTATHLSYFGEVFGRPVGLAPRFSASTRAAAEFWVTSDEAKIDILDAHRDACAFADTTIDELDLEAIGRVPWWGDAPVTLHHVMVHVAADTQRHAGHADILREQIDGAVGLLRGADNLHHHQPDERERHFEQVRAAAVGFR